MDTITLYVDPPATQDIGGAYIRLVLGLAQRQPSLLQSYLGPEAWVEMVAAEPASLEDLRTHAVAVATAAQRSDLPDARRDRILRNVRALLWLIRVELGESLIFTEQVRLLLDVQPESVDEQIFQQARESLAELIESDFTDFAEQYTLPAETVCPLLDQATQQLWSQLEADIQGNPIEVRLTEGDGQPSYQAGVWHLPRQAQVRADRIYHLAAAVCATHALATAAQTRYAAGEVEAAALLTVGPMQIIRQGLPSVILSRLPIYEKLPDLLPSIDLPPLDGETWQAIHLAEDALRWVSANGVMLLHHEGLRPRAVRRYLAANGLFSRDEAESQLEILSNPTQAAHLFAPLIGAPLLQQYLDRTGHAINQLLSDPPVPSKMIFTVRFE